MLQRGFTKRKLHIWKIADVHIGRRGEGGLQLVIGGREDEVSDENFGGHVFWGLLDSGGGGTGGGFTRTQKELRGTLRAGVAKDAKLRED